MSRLLADALELAALLRPAWADVSAGIPSWHLRNEGDDDDDSADDSADDDDSADVTDDDDKDDDTAADDKPADDAELEEWKAYARKWEKRAKDKPTGAGRAEREAARLKRERDELAAKLKEREDADKSDQEKAIDTAKRQAREEALSEADKDRRADRLEMAVSKVAAIRGVKLGAGDDAKTVKFTDPDDVLMWLEKQIDRGDIDADTIYKDGRVDMDALAEELMALAEAKPGWLAGAGKQNGIPAGSSDAGKGAAPSGNSVESELKAVQRRRHSTVT
jgi:hypothetical protein